MKILIDVCLSPEWVPFFGTRGIESIHWTTIGECHADDSVIFSYAHDNNFIIFTHDLDFGTLLAQTKAQEPERHSSQSSRSQPGRHWLFSCAAA